MAEQRFHIDIEDSAGNRLGSGPLASASRWRYTARMDQAGEFSFTMAATDPQRDVVQKKRIARAWALLGDTWTEVGAGVIDNIQRRPQRDGTVLWEVSGGDLLRELTYRSVRDLKLYFNNLPVSPATALAAVAPYAPPGWTFTPDPSPPVPELYGRFNGESVLAAIVKIAEKSQSHFYRGTGRSVTFASTFTPSGIRAVVPGPGGLAPETCAIIRLQETIDSYDLLTRIHPRGSGNGDVPVTLKATTRTAPAGYTLNKAQNYIEHDAAVAQYGVIEEFVDWREIAPVENTPSDVRAAANQLFDEAMRELTRRSQGTETPYYDLQLAGCATLLRPMQTIRTVYRDTVAGIDIDRDLNILEATWEVDESGVQTTGVRVTTADRWPQGEAGAVADALTQGRIYQALPQLNANEYVTSFTKHVDATETATFRFRFSKAVTALRWAFFEFQLLPFESTVKSVTGETVTSSAGGAAVGSSATSGAHTHTVTIAAHAHTVTVPAHAHSVTVPGHSHSVTVPSHQHSVTIPSHTHGVPNHQHFIAITLGQTPTYPVGYSAAGTAGGLVSGAPGSTHNYPTNANSGATTSNSGGGSTQTSSSGGGTTASSSTVNETVGTSGQQSQVVTSSSQQAQTTTTSSSGGTHTHTVTIPSHTHTVTPVITAVYGIFRESSAKTYDIDELEYRVNSGAWSPLSDAEDLGDGWHRLNITAALQDTDTLLPVQDSNRVEVRATRTGVGIIAWTWTDLEIWFETAGPHGLSEGDHIIVEGAAAGQIVGRNVNGSYVVVAVGGVEGQTSFQVTAPTSSLDISPADQGHVRPVKTATIDAQLSVHTTIQPIYQ